MLSGERMETGTDERRTVLVALRKRLGAAQGYVEKKAKIDHSRFSRWECGYVELSEIELMKVEQVLTDFLSDRLASLQAAREELDVASA